MPYVRTSLLAVLIVLSATGLAAAGPVLVYHFDELRGNLAFDYSGNGNHGTLLNGTARTTDTAFGRALSFDGVNDYVEVPHDDSLNLPDRYTIEMWLKPTEADTFRGVMGKPDWNDWVLIRRESNNKIMVQNGYSDGTRSGEVEGGDLSSGWHHTAFTWDRTGDRRIRVYVDGANVATSSVQPDLPLQLTTAALTFGKMGGQLFPGVIDEVAIYDTAMSDAEILARAQGGPPQPTSLPLSMPVADGVVLHLDEMHGSVAHDATIAGRNGAISGATWGPGVYGGALHFDGFDDVVRVPMPAAESPTDGLSVEGWFYLDQDPNVGDKNNWRWIFAKGSWGPFASILEQDRRIGFDIIVDGERERWWAGAKMPLDEWAHVAWIYDAAARMMRLYVNGQEYLHALDPSKPRSDYRLDTNDEDFYLSWARGVDNPDGSGAFPGWMDEIALYRYALTPDEVRLRYAFGPPVALVPEPATLALLPTGILLLMLALRRKTLRGG